MTVTERDLREFNIDTFIQQCLKLDLVDILLRIKNFGMLIQGIQLMPEESSANKEIVLNFSRFIIHIQIIIAKDREAIKPIGMSAENFFKVKPVVKKLVTTGYLKKEWLDLY